MPVEGSVERTDRQGGIHEIVARLSSLDCPVLPNVELVGDFPDDLLKDVLERDQPLEGAILVHHEGEVGSPPEELPYLLVEGGGFGNEVGGHGDGEQVELTEC